MGCDQYVEADNTGPLVLDITLGVSGSVIVEDRNTSIYATLNGRASSAVLDFGDGTAITNMSLVLMYHAWTNPGDYTITFTAYNLDHPAGVSKSVGVTVIPLLSPTISNTAWTTNGFSLGFQSQPGVLYTLQQTTNLAPPAVWTTVTHIVGNGNIQTLTDTTTTNQMRFYRLWPH
jgi:hypothetical protein